MKKPNVKALAVELEAGDLVVTKSDRGETIRLLVLREHSNDNASRQIVCIVETGSKRRVGLRSFSHKGDYTVESDGAVGAVAALSFDTLRVLVDRMPQSTAISALSAVTTARQLSLI